MVSAPAVRSTGRAGRSGRLVVRSMFERFTEKAIKVVMLAQEEARRYAPSSFRLPIKSLTTIIISYLPERMVHTLVPPPC